MRSLHFKILSASFLIAFLSVGIAASINMRVSSLLSHIKMYGLLLEIVLSVLTYWFHNIVTLNSLPASNDIITIMFCNNNNNNNNNGQHNAENKRKMTREEDAWTIPT